MVTTHFQARPIIATLHAANGNSTGTGAYWPELGETPNLDRLFRAEAMCDKTLIQWPSSRDEEARKHFRTLRIRPSEIERCTASRFLRPPFGDEVVMQAFVTFNAARRLREAKLTSTLHRLD